MAVGTQGDVQLSPTPVQPLKRHRKLSSVMDFRNISPYSPESVYTNLIIVEHSLRSQFIELQKARRWGLVFFWSTILGAIYMTYYNRYSSSGHRSLRLLCTFLTVAFYICIGLFFLTGMYTKTFKIAPRFLPETNKGMRTLNIKMVKTRSSYTEKLMRILNPVYSRTLSGPVKLVLSTREFTPAFIEEWELFREAYWTKQAKRNKLLKKKNPQ